MRASFVGMCAIVLQAMIAAGPAGVADASAQEAAAVPDGPRFLLAVAGRVKPVETEVSAVPLLRRRIALTLDDQSIADALRAIRAKTGIEFVYRTEVPTLSKRVTLRAENITVGAALTDILVDAKVDVLLSGGRYVTLVPREAVPVAATGTIVGRVADGKAGTAIAGATVVIEGTRHTATAGNDGRYRIAGVAPGTYTVRARYIGYAPGAASVTVSAGQEATADFTLEKSAQRLDEVVTTGTVVPTQVKALPTPISVVTGDEIQQKGYQRVDQIFRGDVPGAIAWDPGAGNDYYSRISVRGAAGFIASTVPSIKTLVDGVEVADPSFITAIDPNSIDRIEITRGPQASTLYGAGALSGVMQIFTKKGQLGLARPEVAGKLSVGGIGGYGSGNAVQTDNALSVLGGDEKTSYNFGGSYRHSGEWVPSYRSTDWGITAGGQTTQGPFTLAGSARYADKRFDLPWDTRFQAYTYFTQPPDVTKRLRQQTYGLTGTLQATRTWQHVLTVGYDQTYFGSDQTQRRLTTPADSFLATQALHRAKTSFLYHTDLRVGLGKAAGAIVTAGVNYDAYDEVLLLNGATTKTTGTLDGSTYASHTPWANTGYFGQVQFHFAERLFVTGGLRAERNPNFGADFGTAWSPRVGAAYVWGSGPATVKLRASYGESVRAPLPGQRDRAQDAFSVLLANPNLAPERQRGMDGGVELDVGRASLAVTYYNQRAMDLIDFVNIPASPGSLPTYQYQNISRVKNEGWEFEGHLALGPVRLAGTYSITNSTVQQLPSGYVGDLQVGDRMLQIPHTSAGGTITYAPLPHTTLIASATHIGPWMSYDYVALFAVYFGGQPYLGSNRAYWMEYPAVTKVGIGVQQQLTRDVTAFVRAENVGNTLRYEESNLNIPTPRSVMVGANVHY